jgi:DNA methylase
MDRLSASRLSAAPERDAMTRLRQGVLDTAPVTGFTHQFYRYPARFSPAFARAAIEAFTDPGDVVVDPFVGGGTTLVEAAVLGRLGVGSDVSALAKFISDVKTTPLSQSDGRALRGWLDDVLSAGTSEIHNAASGTMPANLDRPGTWRLRRLLTHATRTAAELRPRRREMFARCLLLRTGQWALDSRRSVPTLDEFRTELRSNLDSMLSGINQFGQAIRERHAPPRSRRSLSVVATASVLYRRRFWARLPRPKLILTSPPYAGVHVLYDRWQIGGRRETTAPFWITASPDGHFSSYYTFGDRRNEARYFASAHDAFSGLARLASRETVLVQLVGFSNPRRQLQPYLDMLSRCGFEEVNAGRRGRQWRHVPNRKWYADQMGQTAGSEEVVLVHRMRP